MRHINARTYDAQIAYGLSNIINAWKEKRMFNIRRTYVNYVFWNVWKAYGMFLFNIPRTWIWRHAFLTYSQNMCFISCCVKCVRIWRVSFDMKKKACSNKVINNNPNWFRQCQWPSTEEYICFLYQPFSIIK